MVNAPSGKVGRKSDLQVFARSSPLLAGFARCSPRAPNRRGDGVRGLADRPRACCDGLSADVARVSSGGHSGRRAGGAGRRDEAGGTRHGDVRRAALGGTGVRPTTQHRPVRHRARRYCTTRSHAVLPRQWRRTVHVASSSKPRGRRPGGGILRAGRRGGVTPMPATRWPRALLLLGRVRWISRRCVACAQWPCWDMRLAEWRWAESVGWTGGDTAARAILSERSQLARYTTLQTFFVLRSSLVRPVVCRRAGIAQVRHQDLL